ncbi:MAG: hypothetical protein QNI92_04625 [Desulfobacterales bacterium]|nr:hypothetical protein [Desulfobacterales bacterium]
MNVGTKIITFAVVIIIALVLQVVFIFQDKKELPDLAASEFTKAYFMLDQSMTDRLCSSLASNEEVDLVDNYIFRKHQWAMQRGFDPSYVRSKVFNLHTEIVDLNETEAKVKITGKRYICINPVFAYIGKLFRLGETHLVNETLDVIKEEGHWKVCGAPFELAEEV